MYGDRLHSGETPKAKAIKAAHMCEDAARYLERADEALQLAHGTQCPRNDGLSFLPQLRPFSFGPLAESKQASPKFR